MAIIKPNNNTISAITALPAGVGGKVLQVVTGTSTTETTSNTANTYIDTNLSATITPSSSSNKILILVNQHIALYENGGERVGGSLRLLRGSTRIYGGQEQYDLFNELRSSGSNYIFFYHRADMKYLDSPSTTSATTYKTQMTAAETSDVMRAQINGNCTSTITLMEIAS
jgi:hypothetical protein